MIAASSAGMIGFGRGASTDMLVSAPFALAMMSWWTWHQTSKKLWLVIFYGLLVWARWLKGRLLLRWLCLWWARMPCCGATAKFFFAACRSSAFSCLRPLCCPGIWRCSTKCRSSSASSLLSTILSALAPNLYQHSQPFWYYIPVLLLAAIPWTLFAVPALIDAGKNAWKRWRTNPEPKTIEADAQADDGLTSFLFIWIVVPVVFFSISRAKLPGYILPAIPAAALLTADYVHRT